MLKIGENEMEIFNNKYIRDGIAYASVVGGFTVSNTNEYIRLFGYLVWVVTNTFWFVDAYKRNDKGQFKMWGLYIISVFVGLYYTLEMF